MDDLITESHRNLIQRRKETATKRRSDHRKYRITHKNHSQKVNPICGIVLNLHRKSTCSSVLQNYIQCENYYPYKNCKCYRFSGCNHFTKPYVPISPGMHKPKATESWLDRNEEQFWSRKQNTLNKQLGNQISYCNNYGIYIEPHQGN